ncbi:hypothetical protein ACVGWR_07935, partial [Enterobacter hormaechei]
PTSDILKGENLIGQGRFKLGRPEAEVDQSSNLNPFNDLQPDELQNLSLIHISEPTRLVL